ncbi:MAG: hypothetical protein ABWX61_02675 [Paenisporosarcina sp.]
MNRKWIAGFLMAAVSIAALVFIIKGNINVAVLFMTALFALSNSFRAINLKEKGFNKEAKWMRGMSIFFVIAFIFVLLTIIL